MFDNFYNCMTIWSGTDDGAHCDDTTAAAALGTRCKTFIFTNIFLLKASCNEYNKLKYTE